MGGDLDIGTDHARDQALIAILAEYPCFGGCGRSWDEAGGGWAEFEARDDGAPGAQLAPRWYCRECAPAHWSGMPLATGRETH
jgi:hypothetical protein